MPEIVFNPIPTGWGGQKLPPPKILKVKNRVRVRSFLILGTIAEDFLQGYGILAIFLKEHENTKRNFYPIRNYLP